MAAKIIHENSSGRPPVPGWRPIPASNGWSWCQFNLSNGDALAVAAFQVGTLQVNPQVPYGWYLRRAGDRWKQIYLVGSLKIEMLEFALTSMDV